jgi:NAD+ synthase (glutamine-hydrolysing)
MRLALAQLNPTVGDLEGNLGKLKGALTQAVEQRAELLVCPEMFLTGYPPRDLLERDWFVDRVERALGAVSELSAAHPETGLLVGTVSRSGRETGTGLHNSAVLFRAGEVLYQHHKSLLPTYDVFDEARYFDRAEGVGVVRLGGETLGISICEDAWNEPELWHTVIYDLDPIERQARLGATLFINLSASPFYAGKDEIRYRIFSRHARRHGAPFVLVNQVGANDELVFDGRSLCVSPDGALLAYLPAFEESLSLVDTSDSGGERFVADERAASVHAALVLGIRDYMGKCGFGRAAVGLSGGIDSAVVCALAAEALGPANVTGVTMPSPFSTSGSVADSLALAGNLGVRVHSIEISRLYEAYGEALTGLIPWDRVDVTQENIQARIRGNILMALSNHEGSLVLSTGNKSELAVGYCTLYGDMSGGLAVISDVPKTMVYEIARHINRDREIIPTAIIEKPPSAELRPEQLDRDTLPPYETLDAILARYVDAGESVDSIVEEGFDRETVMWVAKAVNANEYKRRQAAPGLKVTSKAFGMGRRMPIAARFEP